MAYAKYAKKSKTIKRNSTSARRASGNVKRVSTTRKAAEAAFKRGVKAGMRMRRSNSRRTYFYG